MQEIIGWTPHRNSPLTAGGRCLRPSGEHPPLNGREACEVCGATPIYELPTRPKTVPCTRCGKNPAPAPTSIEVDPLCTDCLRTMNRTVPAFHTDDFKDCPGYGDDCGTKIHFQDDLCADCFTARLDDQSPRIPR